MYRFDLAVEAERLLIEALAEVYAKLHTVNTENGPVLDAWEVDQVLCWTAKSVFMSFNLPDAVKEATNVRMEGQ